MCTTCYPTIAANHPRPPDPASGPSTPEPRTHQQVPLELQQPARGLRSRPPPTPRLQNPRAQACFPDLPDPHARERHRVVGSLPEHRSTSPPAQGRPSHEVSLAPTRNAKHKDYDAPERPASHRAVTTPAQRKAPRWTPARRSCRLLVCEARRKRAREPVSPRARVDSETTRQLLPSHAPHQQL